MSTDTNNTPSQDAREAYDEDGEHITANAAYANGLRAGLVAALGESGFEQRDLYDTFGWPEDPSEEELFVLGLRNPVAWTVINKPAFTCWRDPPEVVDNADQDDTEFEQQCRKLEQKDVWSYSERIDRLAGFGEHGVLVFGFSDTNGPEGLSTPVEEDQFSGLDDLRNIRVYPQVAIEDIEWGEAGTDRWGKPVTYDIDTGDDTDDSPEDEETTLTVHHTRVIDAPATRLLDDETLARPRHEPVLNPIYDIEKTLGSAAEQSYRGADYGLHANVDPEKVDTRGDATDQLADELEDWYHGLQPFIRTVGADIEQLGGDIQDPSGIIDNELSMVSMVTGIPKNELTGNRQGEVSGSREDKRSYFGAMEERREQYDTPHIARPIISTLIHVGVLPSPLGSGFGFDWPDLHEQSEADEAEIESKRSQVVKNTQAAIPDLRGERAEEYIETGEFKDRDSQPTANEYVDENDQATWDQFENSMEDR